MDIWVWTGIIVTCLILEFFSSELICIWFSTAGVISLILAICHVPLWIQIVTFVVLSIILIFSLRKLCKKLLRGKDEKTNSDSLIGKKFKLISDLTEDIMGTIKINGVIWNCEGIDGFCAKEGELVQIVEIKGNKLIVKGGLK